MIQNFPHQVSLIKFTFQSLTKSFVQITQGEMRRAYILTAYSNLLLNKQVQKIGCKNFYLVIPVWVHVPGPASLSEVAPVLFSFQQQTRRCPYRHHSLLLLFAAGQKAFNLDQISKCTLPSYHLPKGDPCLHSCSFSVWLTFWFLFRYHKEQSRRKAIHSWDKGC